MPTVIIVGAADIFFRAKLEQMTKACGGTPIFVTSEAELHRALVKSDRRTLIVVDVEKSIVDLAQVALMKGQAELVGFYPHVQKELLEKARKSGITRTVPRSRIEEMVKRFLVQ
ncbi:MAG: hypothetical protein ACYC7D_11215 [Nitrososphaerales archaeon]